jgi:hypothetical protein
MIKIVVSRWWQLFLMLVILGVIITLSYLCGEENGQLRARADNPMYEMWLLHRDSQVDKPDIQITGELKTNHKNYEKISKKVSKN